MIVPFIGCKADDTQNTSDTAVIQPTKKPNILLIIADDMGKDATPTFIEGNLKPVTPNINSFFTNGLTFINLWVNPTCSPTRASIISGKYGFKTGVKKAGDILSTSEINN